MATFIPNPGIPVEEEEKAVIPAHSPYEPPKPPVSASFAEDRANVVSTIVGDPEAKSTIKQEITTTGQTRSWDRQGYRTERTAQEMNRYVEEVIAKGRADGNVDIAKELQTPSPEFGEPIRAEAAERTTTAYTLPELDAYVAAVKDVRTTRFQDTEDRVTDARYNQAYVAQQIRLGKDEIKQHSEELETALSEGGFSANSTEETIAGFGSYFIPLYEMLNINSIALSTELEGDTPSYRVLTGQVKVDLKEEFVRRGKEGGPDAQMEMLSELAEYLMSTDGLRTDLISQSILTDLTSEDVLYREDPSRTAWDTFDDVAAILEIIPVLALLKGAVKVAGKGLFKVASSGSQQAKMLANKEAGQLELAERLVEESRVSGEEGWQIEAEDVVALQLPKRSDGADDIIEDLPDGASELAEQLRADQRRIDEIEELGGEILEQTRAGVYSDTEIATVIDKQIKDTTAVFQGQLRPALSTVRTSDSGTTLNFRAVIGKNDTRGFGGERPAFEQAADLMAQGYENVRIMVKDGSDIKPYLTGDEALTKLTEIKRRTVSSTRGEYYVQFDDKYVMRPTDRGLLGDDAVNTKAWMGRSGRYLFPPSSQFNPKFYQPYLSKWYSAQALSGAMSAIVAPIRKMSFATQRTIDDMYSFQADFYSKNTRKATYNEYRAAFPDADDEAFRGLYLMERYYDFLYDIQNARLYDDWVGQGYITLRSRGFDASYHGAPIYEAKSVKRDFGLKGNNVQAYDPATNEVRTLSYKELDELYDNGGNILETDLDITVEEGTYSRLIINDAKNKDWQAGPLASNPLRYEQGYWPRVYEDHVFIEVEIPGMTRNGKQVAKGRNTKIVSFAPTREAAERWIAGKMDDPDYKGEKWTIKEGSRLQDADRTAVDMERMQLEGRLFFDNRNRTLIGDVTGGTADIVSPIDMLQRSANMVAREAGAGETMRGFKQAWYKQYGDMLAGSIDEFYSMTAGEVQGALTSALKRGTTEERARALEAHETWDYMRTMEGTVSDTSIWFRERAVQAADWLHEWTWKSAKPLEPTAKWLTRHAHEAAPAEKMRSLAFIDFIATRPGRQLMLQGAQHLFLTPLDPKYAVYFLQRDAFGLLQGTRRESNRLLGGNEKSVVKRNSALMGITEDEFNLLVSEFHKSGLLQGVDLQSYTGKSVRVQNQIPKTRTAEVVGAPFRAAGRGIDWMKNAGFGMGESYNLSASYAMALRRYRVENDLMDMPLTALKPSDWEAVKLKASGYALSMVKPGNTKLQRGWLANATQFLSFTQKVALTFVRAGVPLPGADAIPGVKALDKKITALGNKDFTRKEARRLLLGQAILFGGSGFGVRPEVERGLYDLGLYDVSPELVDVISGGMVDYLIDGAIGLAVGRDVDLAVGDALAPGAGIINVGRDMVETVFDNPPIDFVIGPSGATMGRLYDAWWLARRTVDLDSVYTEAEQWTMATELILAGGMSGYNDFLKARMMHKHGRAIAKNGQPMGNEVGWTEILAKGLLGLSTEESLDAYKLSQEVKSKELDEIAFEYYGQMRYIFKQYGDGLHDDDWVKSQIDMKKSLLQLGLNEHEYRYVVKKYGQLAMRDTDAPRSLVNDVVRGLRLGVPIDEYIYQWIQDNEDLSPKELEAVKFLWSEATGRPELDIEAELGHIQLEAESIDRIQQR